MFILFHRAKRASYFLKVHVFLYKKLSKASSSKGFLFWGIKYLFCSYKSFLMGFSKLTVEVVDYWIIDYNQGQGVLPYSSRINYHHVWGSLVFKSDRKFFLTELGWVQCLEKLSTEIIISTYSFKEQMNSNPMSKFNSALLNQSKFHSKWSVFNILGPKIPNIGILGEEILKNRHQNWIQHAWISLCAKFHSERSIFHHFRGQNLKIEFILGELGLVGIYFGRMGVGGDLFLAGWGSILARWDLFCLGGNGWGSVGVSEGSVGMSGDGSTV